MFHTDRVHREGSLVSQVLGVNGQDIVLKIGAASPGDAGVVPQTTGTIAVGGHNCIVGEQEVTEDSTVGEGAGYLDEVHVCEVFGDGEARPIRLNEEDDGKRRHAVGANGVEVPPVVRGSIDALDLGAVEEVVARGELAVCLAILWRGLVGLDALDRWAFLGAQRCCAETERESKIS